MGRRKSTLPSPGLLAVIMKRKGMFETNEKVDSTYALGKTTAKSLSTVAPMLSVMIQ